MVDRVAIYVLYDPRESEKVRYVGQSIAPNRRLVEHRNAVNDGRLVSLWCRDLKRSGVKVEMKVIEWIDDCDDYNGCESKWIAHYREIEKDLLNLDSGGAGGISVQRSAKDLFDRIMPPGEWLSVKRRTNEEIELYIRLIEELDNVVKYGKNGISVPA